MELDKTCFFTNARTGEVYTPVNIYDLNTFDLPSPRESAKCSLKSNSLIKGYSANTNNGLYRNYNEDRVSIILNIVKPKKDNEDEKVQSWPPISFFGLYDGHGGSKCADFLRDNLHKFVSLEVKYSKIIREKTFPFSTKAAVLKGFSEAEKYFIELAETGRLPN